MSSYFRVDPKRPPEMLAIFRYEERPYAIQALIIQEIVRHDDITPVGNTESYIVGILNLRGKIVTVIDLGCRLGNGLPSPATGKSVLVIPYADEHLGLLVDTIQDVVSIDPNKVTAVPQNVAPETAVFFQGIIKMDDEMITILNPEKVLLPETVTFEIS